MQAIILAAGMGKRLKNLTAHATKCMVPVNGVTLIERAVRQLEALSLSRIVLVVGYQSEALVDFVTTLDVHTPIEIVENMQYATTNNIFSLFLARHFLLAEDTLLLESDLIFEPSVLRTIVEDKYPNLALVAKYESWMDGTVVTIDKDHNITEFLTKTQFKFCDQETYYKTVNIYKFSKDFSQSHYVPFLEAYCKALGNNEYYEQVLKVIALLDNPGIKAKVLEDQRWYEIDDIQDLDIAESLFASTPASGYEKISKRFGGYWRYPKLLDFCYLVNPYYPPYRLLEEIKANFDRLIYDYPSGQQVNSLLAGKYFNVDKDMVVVGNGAAELIKSLLESMQGPIGTIKPTFDEYPNRLPQEKVIAFTPALPLFAYDSADIMHFFHDKHISALILINPDNPTGHLLPKENVHELVRWSKKHRIQLVVDESFMDFSDNGADSSLLEESFLQANPHVIIVKSISKSFGVPGLRLGILCSGNKNLISVMKKDVSIWNINSFAEFYLQICEKYRSDYEEALKKFKEIRSTFFSELLACSVLQPYPSQANYFICEVVPPYTSDYITETLFSRNILIKNLAGKGGIEGEFVRIAIRREEENAKLLHILRNLPPPES